LKKDLLANVLNLLKHCKNQFFITLWNILSAFQVQALRPHPKICCIFL